MSLREYSLEKGNFYEFSIWAINSSDYYTKVEFVEQRADDMVAFASTENIHTASYSNFTGYFQAPADSVYNLGMRATSNNDYVSFDDFSVRLVEYGTPKRFNVKDITKTSASFSWIGNADGYRFRLMFRDQVVVDSVLKGHSIDVDNLTGATNYTASVVAFRADQDTTAPATLSFFTDCDVYALPYEQNFNTAYGSEIPACWDAVTGTAIGDMRYNWATATEGSNVIARISTSGAYGTAALRSPEFSLEDEGMALSFRYINKSVVDLKVAVSTDAGKTFADTIATLTPANWTAKAIELDAKYVGKKIMVAFIVKSKAVGNGEFIAIDDFRIACYGGEKPLADVHCSGFDYLRNGFVVLKEELQPGTNTISKLFTYDITDNTATACDTLKILTLTVNPTKETHLYETICEGQTSTTAPFVGDDAKSEAGDWVKTYTSSLKCDSNVILHLTVLPKMHYISASICEGDVYEFGDLKCDTAGTYVVYGKNHLQCDSNVTLRLEVVPTHYRQTMYVCEGSRYEWVEADMVLDETKEYTYKFETAGRCDSIVTIDFHVLPTRVTVRKNVCAGAEVIFGEGSDAETITIPGTYEKTFKNSLGCDSIVTLILNYNDPIVAEYDDYTCQDYEYNNYGFNIPVITKDTVLLKTIKNDAGCDSTTKVNVDFIATIYTDSIAEIDEGGKFEFCGQTYTTAGTYTCEGRSTVTSCDSIVRLTLKVNPGVGVDNVFAQPIVIAPNPISLGETTYVEHEWTADEQHGLKVEVLNSLGQTIASYTPASYPIEVKGIEVSGVYYIRVTSGTGKVYVGKLIVR